MSTRQNSRTTAGRRAAAAGRYTPYSLYRRALRLEPLEDRSLLAVVIVDTLADTINFNDNRTSLREAIFATNTVLGADFIDFASSLTLGSNSKIVLTQGPLTITDSLTIDWPNAGTLTIDASGNDPSPTMNNGDGSRVFNVVRSFLGSSVNVKLSYLSITGADSAGNGGAIFNSANLTISDCEIFDNFAEDGGAVYSDRGDVLISTSSITNNRADSSGGGVFIRTGELNIVESTISGNSARSAGGLHIIGGEGTILDSSIDHNTAVGGVGGGIAVGTTISGSGRITVTRSTIDHNSAGFGGGIDGSNILVDSSTISNNVAGKGAGIYHTLGGLHIVNSTLSGNQSVGEGGGGAIYNFQGGTTIRFSTITQNSNGLLAVSTKNATYRLFSSIVAGNFGSDLELDDNNANTFQSDGFNIVGIGEGIGAFNKAGDQTGVLDPLLGPLADNGGPTFTHALLASSPAINAGDLAAVAGVDGVPEFDQRGTPFGRVFHGRIDIGAFEYQQVSDLNLVVDTLADENDGNYSRGDLSLREAIALANMWPSVDTIHFDAALTTSGPATILLTQGELAITDAVSIFGLGADLLTINASGNDPTPGLYDRNGSRIFNIGDDTASQIAVSIEGLRITGGDRGSSGSAISSSEALHLSDLVFEKNGGGYSVVSSAGALTIDRNRFSTNSSTGLAGASIISANGITIRDSEISGNVGVGLGLSGAGLIADTTFSNNTDSGIVVKTNQHVEISRSAITGHTSGNGGMWLFAFQGGSILVSGSVISNNKGGGGAGITASPNGSVIIQDSVFSNNDGRFGGGLRAAGNVQILHSEFIGNTTSDSGGGIYFSGVGTLASSLQVSYSKFYNNSAARIGGAIYVELLNGQSASIGDSTIDSNMAGINGGGIFITNNRGTATLGDVNVLNNVATTDGGGIYVRNSNSLGTVAIENGDVIGNGSGGVGGGIWASGALAIKESAISGNSALGLGGGMYFRGSFVSGGLTFSDNQVTDNRGRNGGGIAIGGPGGTSTITRSTISHNIAERVANQNGSGGGIYVQQGEVQIVDSTINENAAGYDGGGIFSRSVSLERTTVSNNVAANRGGGLNLSGGGTIRDSTITGNSAKTGGALYATTIPSPIAVSNVTVSHTTIAQNEATSTTGGIYTPGARLSLDHSIVAQNTSPSTSDDLFGIPSWPITAVYTLIGDNNGSGLAEAPVGAPDANGNLIGGAIHGTIDPLLGPLADNGGPTFTHALLAGSPAINSGDLNAVAGVDGVPEFDQRGMPFGRVFNGRIDIGAFESQEASDLNLLIDTLVDENDGDYGRGDLSLREAIALANQYAGPNFLLLVDTIHFDPALTAGGPAAIVLTMGELKITSSMSIVGLGAEVLTVDASGNDLTPDVNDGKGSRIFSIAGPSVATNINVAMSGLTLTGGDSAQAGGAINGLFANLALADSTITGNAASLGGGAIYQQSGNLAVNDSIISGNASFGLQGSGGAIYFLDTRSARFSRQLEIRDSQISHNTAGMKGGGVAARFIGRGTITIADSQISGNKATSSNGAGGGLYLNVPSGTVAYSMTTTIDHTTIDHNMVGANGRGGGLFALNGGLTITNSEITSNTGGSTGGGIQVSNSRNLTIRNSTVSGNSTRLAGAGVWAQLTIGTMTLDGDTIANNTTTALGDSKGGGVYGDLRSLANATITGTTLRENSAASGGGAYLRFANGPLNIDHSQIVGNLATATVAGMGGGLFFSSHSSATISNSVIENNASQGTDARGGGIHAAGNLKITDTKIDANTSGRFGGGIFSTAGLQILNSEITNNAAQLTKGVGGGIYQIGFGNLLVTDSLVSGNTATMHAGGVYAPGATTPAAANRANFERVTIMGNSAALDGGGIMTQFRLLTLTDSTVASNTAGRDGGGLWLQNQSALVERSLLHKNTAAGNGGGIASFGISLRVFNSTISQNTATINGGGLWSNDGDSIFHSTFFQNKAGQAGGGAFFTAGNAVIRNSIIAHNTGPSGRDLSGLLGVTFDLHYSLIGSNQGNGLTPAPVGSPDANGNFIGGSVAIDPNLGPLGNNGGPTLTHAPRAGSPAIDAGDPAAVAGELSVPIYDQRGVPFTRVFGGRLDMGAVEWQPNSLPGDYNYDGVVDGGDYLVWRRVGTVPDFRADGNGDGVVNNADYTLWRANFGQVRPPQFASTLVESAAVAVGAPPIGSVLRRANRDVQPSQVVGPQVQQTVVGAPAARPRLRAAQNVEAVEQAPAGLLAWLSESEAAQKAVRQTGRERGVVDHAGDETHAICGGTADALDEAFARLLSV